MNTKDFVKFTLSASILSIGISGCSSLLGNDEETKADQNMDVEVELPTDSFVKVLPDFQALDPLYDLGFEGDFDKGMTAYNEKRYSLALTEWYPLAKERDARAEYYIGIMYLNGLGMPVNYKQGTIWIQRSASQGYAEAQFEFGNLYVAGQKIEQNYDQAIRWLLSAARQGHAGAQFNYGLLYQQGKVPLSSNLMEVYKQSRSQTFNDQQAFKWYTSAATQGHGAAQNNLAWMYLYGRGVAQSDQLALKWYTEAANQGVIDAQYNLALLYEQGKGTTLNLQEALFWHSKAADQGYFPSQQRLPILQQQIESFDTSLVLFGTTLAQATRDALRNKLKSNNGNMLREQDNYWFDIYESSRLLKRTDRLFVGYSLQTDHVASLEYRFPSQNDPNFVLTVIDMVKEKYGPPIETEGSLDFGKVKYSWIVKDTEVFVTRYWPDTTVYLSYHIGSNYQQMVSEMPENAEELIYNMVFETY
ncbi:sel1 repeat family protein [Psychrosphaera sp. F3M07]|uniref:tetratricopeptide repeat protein n=1 Tax=Psychrosphaera sp. F3M07 TaxID=2841560 RepID=UPI001C08CE2A|nr:tetratricopeptide repeat protein [Psychrosphaera sp. F3M07]MBU2918693.1 sel1 repeat family protein [Psychrosphaera sp. F3M07]